MERCFRCARQRRPLRPLVLATKRVEEVSANVANICSCRSRCRQLLFTHVPLFRQQGTHETRAAGTNRQIYSAPKSARSTHFAIPFPAGVPPRRLPPAFF